MSFPGKADNNSTDTSGVDTSTGTATATVASNTNTSTSTATAKHSGSDKRLRVQRACDTCKRRKVKCDGMKPCSNCVKHLSECSYDFSRGKVKKGKHKSPSRMDVTQNTQVQQQLQEQLQSQLPHHGFPVRQHIQLPSQPITQAPPPSAAAAAVVTADTSVPAYLRDGSTGHEVVEGQTAKILLQLNPKIAGNVSPPVVLPSSSVAAPVPVPGSMVPPSLIPFPNAQIPQQQQQQQQLQLQPMPQPIPPTAPPLPSLPPHASSSSPSSLSGPIPLGPQTRIPIQGPGTPTLPQQVIPPSASSVSITPIMAQTTTGIPLPIQAPSSTVPHSLQTTTTATKSINVGTSAVLSRSKSNSRSNTNNSSSIPTSPENNDNNKNKSLAIDNILANERKLKDEVGVSASASASSSLASTTTRVRNYRSPVNKRHKSSSGNGNMLNGVDVNVDVNMRSLSADNTGKMFNSQQKFILTSPTIRNFNKNFTKTYITTPNLSPWFTFSRDKYRFHRRYQNILPYYLGSSILSELPPEVIKMNNLEIPRVQNYGWNMAGGHYLRLTARITRDMAHGLATIINFDNPVHLSIINKLLKYYFDTVNKPFSIIHESMFWQQFNNGFLQQGKTNNKSTKLFSSMLYLMAITALRFKDGETRTNWRNPEDTFFTPEEKLFLLNHEKILEENLFNYAYFVVSKLTFEWESFELIQSWLLISFYLRTCYRQIACWNALSKAVTMCRGMGLNLNQLPEGVSKNDEIKAWHCYWLVFIMDKLISFQIGRQYQLGLPLPNMMTPSEAYATFEGLKGNNAGISGMDVNLSSNISRSSSNNTPTNNNNSNSSGNNKRRAHKATPVASHEIPLESESLPYNWFSPETIQMFELSLFVMEYQKDKTEELTDAESVVFRTKLSTWQSNYLRENPQLFSTWTDPYQLQPILTYLDIHLTFEIKSLFALMNPPENINKVTSLSFNIDIGTLTSLANLSVNLFQSIFQKQFFFVPWWLNLSQLFSVSLIYVSMMNVGLKISTVQGYLTQCMQMWDIAVSAKVHNPPSMAAQCLWCIKMLNHSICLRMLHSVTVLKEIVGADYGDNSLNKNKFEQFRKVGEEADDQNLDEDETQDRDQSALNLAVNQPRRPQSMPVIGVTSLTHTGNPQGGSIDLAEGHSRHQTHSLNASSLIMDRMTETTPDAQIGVSSVPLPINGTSNSTPSDIFDDDPFNNLQWFDQPFA